MEPYEFVNLAPELRAKTPEFPEYVLKRLDKELSRANITVANILSDYGAKLKMAGKHDEFMQQCLDVVSEIHNVPILAMLGSVKIKPYVFARCQFAGVVRELRGYNHEEIAEVINRERSTISNALVVHENMLGTNAEYRALYAKVKAACQELTLKPKSS